MVGPASVAGMKEGWVQVGAGRLYHGDVMEGLGALEPASVQLIIADPPYFQVLEGEAWDNHWESSDAYLAWVMDWLRACREVLRPDGLCYIFGQLGKREHVWLHFCAEAARMLQFHDMLIWDRAVGYNERHDSFTPQYEMILALRTAVEVRPYFDKGAVRIPYDEKTIATYLKDNRYKDKAARMEHLRKGKYATNILRVPSLKGNSREKLGHPSQKPYSLIEKLVLSSSRQGDEVLDLFAGSGTTAAACQANGRRWIGIEREERFVRMTRERVEGITDLFGAGPGEAR